MAQTSHNKHGKRVRSFRGQKAEKKSKTSGFLVIGVAVLVLALLTFGMARVFGFESHQSTTLADVEVEASNLQSTSLEAGKRRTANAESDTAAPVTVADRETRFLGPPSDSATVSLAEAGQVGQPTLLWFYADWCHVCQQIKPEVVDLGEEYGGKVKIVRLNVDHSVSRDAVRRYGVRATPTFVLFDTQGQLRGNVPGWPGYQTIANAFDQLLTGG